jgi:diaminopimelate decarboxylase
VNPDFELKSSGMKMAGGAKQFGIDAELIPEALEKIKNYGLHYRGLHIFTGSQNLNEESLIAAYSAIFELAEQLQVSAPSTMEKLNIGGGLGIPYFPGEQPINIETIANQLNPMIEKFAKKYPLTEVVMELGRYIVGEAGLYVCEVTDIKESRGTQFVVVNGGLHHQLAASGNFGQVIRKNYPVSVCNKMQQVAEKPVQIVGPLCTPLDLLANQYHLPKIEVGDLIAIYQSGAYGFTASPRDFLSHPEAVEILV